MFLLLPLCAGGCAFLNGKTTEVRSTTENKREGQVVILRGWAGIWSLGLDTLGKKVNAAGIHAAVFQDDQWSSLASVIAKNQGSSQHPEPLVLIGHSYGADNAVRIARSLKSDGVKVDLLVTIDPIAPPLVPSNVCTALNFFESRGVGDTLPAFRGVPLKPAPDFEGQLLNHNLAVNRRDLRVQDVSHIKIEEDEKIHGEILQWLLRISPPRTAVQTIR